MIERIVCIVILLTQLIFAEGSTLLEAGSEAPSFALPNRDGVREYLRTWCGEPLAKPFINKVPRRVILSFWSTTCLPCMKEIPELHRFAETHASDSMKIYLINVDNMTTDELNTYVNKKGWTLPVLADPYQSVAKRYLVNAIPTIYIIAPNGKIEHGFTGIPPQMSAEDFLAEKIFGKKLTKK